MKEYPGRLQYSPMVTLEQYTSDLDKAYAYPQDLARVVQERWANLEPSSDHFDIELPDLIILEHVLSVCYQASLTKEENRPTTFRIVLSDRNFFPLDSGPPEGFLRMDFYEKRPFNVQELCRLAPASSFQNSLIGIELDSTGAPRIWALIYSGPRWLQSVRGGRSVSQTMPPLLIISVKGPGRILVSKGQRPIAEIAQGSLRQFGMDVLSAPWMQNLLHHAYHSSGLTSVLKNPTVDASFGPVLIRNVLRRILASIQSSRHGGTLLLCFGTDIPDKLNTRVRFKYTFEDEEPRRRVQTIAARIHAKLDEDLLFSDSNRAVRWDDYENDRSSGVGHLDEALFDSARFVADLTSVDGAVALSGTLEILGFGGEIVGTLPEVNEIKRASDLDGHFRVTEQADLLGTRHRSAYRLCRAVPEVVAIVASQDGGLRFIRWYDQAVTYWDQIATGQWEI